MSAAIKRTWGVALAVIITVGWGSAGSATMISFNATGGSTMGTSHTAGAPGVNVANWNDMAASTWAGTYSGSIDDPLVSDGSTATGTNLSWSFNGHNGVGAAGSDDARMYASAWDVWGSATITVTDIPYSVYNVHVYVQDSALGATHDPRGGGIAANGVNRALNMFNNSGEFVQYFESTDLGPYSATSPISPKASYVRMSGLNGTLTLTLSEGAPQHRLRFAGFQIEEVPEPGTFLLAVFGIPPLLLVRLRRRVRDRR